MAGNRRRFVWDSGSLGIGAMSTIIAQLVVIGPILQLAGVDALGQWSVTTAIVAFAGLADLGVTPTLSRYTTEYLRRHDMAAVWRLLTLAVATAIAVAVLLLLLLLAVGDGIAGLFGLSSVAPALVYWVPTLVLMQMASNQMRAAAIGAGRAKTAGIVDATSSVALVAVTVAGLVVAPGFGAIALGVLGRSVGVLAGNAIIVASTVPGARFSFPSKEESHSLLRFAVPTGLTGVVSVGYLYAPKLFLGALADLGAVGAFEAANRFAYAIPISVGPLFSAALPFFTRDREDRDRAGARARLLQSSLVCILVLEVGAIVILVPSVLAAFTSNVAGPAAGVTLVCLTTAYSMLSLTGTATTYLRAIARQWLEVRTFAIATTLLLLLLVVLAPGGADGAAVAMTISSLVYFVLLRLAMARNSLVRAAPQWLDAVVVILSALVAGLASRIAVGQSSLSPVIFLVIYLMVVLAFLVSIGSYRRVVLGARSTFQSSRGLGKRDAA